MLHGKKSAIYKSKSGSNGILFQKLFWPTVKKIVLVIEIFLDITRTIFETEYFFDLLLEVFADLYSFERLKCKLEQINGM